MIPGIKAGGKFTIETTIRDKDGNIKSHTIEEGVTVEAKEKAEEMPKKKKTPNDYTAYSVRGEEGGWV